MDFLFLLEATLLWTLWSLFVNWASTPICRETCECSSRITHRERLNLKSYDCHLPASSGPPQSRSLPKRRGKICMKGRNKGIAYLISSSHRGTQHLHEVTLKFDDIRRHQNFISTIHRRYLLLTQMIFPLSFLLFLFFRL